MKCDPKFIRAVLDHQHVDAQVLRLVLEYLYSGQVVVPDQLIISVATWADEIMVTSLKKQCLEYYSEVLLQPQNCLEFYVTCEKLMHQEGKGDALMALKKGMDAGITSGRGVLKDMDVKSVWLLISFESLTAGERWAIVVGHLKVKQGIENLTIEAGLAGGFDLQKGFQLLNGYSERLVQTEWPDMQECNTSAWKNSFVESKGVDSNLKLDKRKRKQLEEGNDSDSDTSVPKKLKSYSRNLATAILLQLLTLPQATFEVLIYPYLGLFSVDAQTILNNHFDKSLRYSWSIKQRKFLSKILSDDLFSTFFEELKRYTKSLEVKKAELIYRASGMYSTVLYFAEYSNNEQKKDSTVRNSMQHVMANQTH
ncbi:UNVERIFIED_CONTAM: hypothetical protein HDU68_004821 [Siphonaria sp. JEL0065]|nr:hypothetical protein HDU68_004821 [Siphonaria sp. JEL0065]